MTIFPKIRAGQEIQSHEHAATNLTTPSLPSRTLFSAPEKR